MEISGLSRGTRVAKSHLSGSAVHVWDLRRLRFRGVDVRGCGSQEEGDWALDARARPRIPLGDLLKNII